MNADQVKDALRGRHPAVLRRPGYLDGPGPWTTIEEWRRIDLLAIAAWSSVKGFPPHGRIGYEVKVSRSDYRRELQKPRKRADAVAFCHEFYLATPADLLRPHEVAWPEPPGFQDGDPFRPMPCPGVHGARCIDGQVGFGRGRLRTIDARRRGTGWGYSSRHYRATCPLCLGSGQIGPSDVERAGAPPLWIPADVGLVEVHLDGRVTVAKRAPRRQPEATTRGRFGLSAHLEAGARAGMTDGELADLVRWISIRPDPRHAALRRG